jgi:hypothetical protein
MKNYEVGIIIAVILVIGYAWYKSQQSATPVNPVNAASPGYKAGTP